jgi:hypothetical protein
MIAAFDIKTGLEHWPFGSYPMYSTVYTKQLYWLRLYGVTDRGEISLGGERDFPPFDQSRLIMALERLQGQKRDQALRNLQSLYNRRPTGPPIRGLRLYALRWTLRAGMQGSESPQERILIAEVAADKAGR